MQAPRYRSVSRAILVVGILLALVPEIVPSARTNGTIEFANWAWTTIIAAFALAPYAVIVVLSSPAQPAPRRRLARGLAAGTALAAMTALGLLLLLSGYVLLFGGTPLLTLRIVSVIVLIAMNAWMLWRSLGRDVLGDAMFFGGVAGAVVFALVAVRTLQRIEASAVQRVQESQADLYTSEQQAIHALRELAVCAITYRVTHGGHLPPELPDLIAATGCDPSLASPSAAPHYTISLSVDPADTLHPAATMGCAFTATFIGELRSGSESRVDGRTLWSTCAGHVYARERGQPAGTRARVSEGFPSEVHVLFRSLLMSAHESDGRYPLTLSALLTSSYLHDRRYIYEGSVLGAQQRADLDSNVFRAGRYVARYVPVAGSFHIEVRCDTYGPECMRGYVVDTSGAVRGTGEPRPARSTDPLAEQCEFTEAWCNGQPGLLYKPRALSRDSL